MQIVADNMETRERHIITPDTKVLGGVFLGRGAVAVDFDEAPEAYERAYDAVDATLSEEEQESPLLTALALSRTVRNIIPYSLEEASRILKTAAQKSGMARLDQSHEIGLSQFIFKGGNCQHQTLIGAAMLELLQDKRNLRGEVSVEPDVMSLPDPSDFSVMEFQKHISGDGSTYVQHLSPYELQADRHTWVRYTADGQRIIMDVGDDYVISLEDHDIPANSQYFRLEERKTAQ